MECALPLFLCYTFIQRSLAVGIILAVVAALLGTVVVLRRMSFFSDAIAHTSLTGIALGLVIGISATLGSVIFSVGIGLFMGLLIQKKKLATDTIIGVLFSSSIALAVFILTIMPAFRADLTSLLFGDILAVSATDVYLALGLMLVALIFFKVFSKPLLSLAFNRELALVEHKKMIRVEYAFLAILALTIALSLKILGAILVSALIIIPAATAQNIAKDLRQMFLSAIVVGVLGVVLGLYGSFLFNSPSGSTIVLVMTAFFLLSLLFRRD